MSVVVWDGKTLAADTQGTVGSQISRTSKIFRHKNARLGLVGNYGRGLELVEWFKSGEKIAKFPELDDDEDYAALIVIKDGETPYVYPGNERKEPVLDSFYAWGSGSNFALGALQMGASAVEAVEATCRWSTDCSLPYEALS